MNGKEKTSAQSINELLLLQNRVAELEHNLSVALKEKEDLQESESRFRRMVESSTDVIFDIDRQGRIRYFSPVEKDIWGYDQEDVIGKNFIEFVHPDDRDLLGQRFLELSSGVEKPLIYRIKSKAGEFRWVRTKTKPRMENGTLVGASGTLIDITDLKLVEEALRESEANYRRLFDSSPAVIYQIDFRTGKFLKANDIVCEYLGCTQEEITSLSPYDLLTDESKVVFLERLSKMSLGEKVAENPEFEVIDKNGSRWWLQLSTKNIYDSEGLAGSDVIGHDITKRKQAEKDLRESEERYRDIIENVLDVYYRTDGQGNLVMISPSGPALLGYESSGDILGSSVADKLYMIPEERGKFLSIMKEDGQVHGYEVVLKHQDGTPMPVSTSSRYYYDADGNALGIEGFFRDIRDRKRAEEVLKESEELGKSILMSVPYGLFGVEKRRVFFANAAMETVFGWSPEELIGKSTRILFRDDEEWEDYGAMLYQWLRKIPVVTFESNIPFVRKDGTEILCRNSVSRIGEELGKTNRIVATFEDITDRKQSEKALLESEERYRMIFNHSPLGVMHFDSNGVIRDFNEKFAQIMGAPREKILGFNMLERLHDQAMLRAVKDALGGILGYYEGDYLSITGSKTTPMRAIYQSIITEDGLFLGAVGLFEDITEKKQVEAERHELEERLQRAEKMESLGLLAGGVAHDLNNVLGIVVGYAEMLIDEMDKANPMRDDLKKILEGGNRSAAIVQDLLTLARRGVQTKKAVNLNATIADCQKTPEVEIVLSRNPQVKLKTDLESDLLNIMGSPVYLSKTIVNLISNAVEAMPNGGVLKIATTNQYLDIPIHGYDKVREGDYVVLTVSDTGEGILEGDIKRIFEPFYTKKIMGRSGTGLGLAVVWGTIKDHNGYINVVSEEGKGTAFTTLYFPVTREEIASDQISISMSEYMGRSETILVVDDINRQCELASRMLTKLNYIVSTVASGEEAIEYLKKNKVDLIVLDMIMDPGIDGLETYEKVLEINPVQKAVIVSGFSESDRVKEAQKLGAGAYVKKPYVLERLGMAVRRELDRT